MHGDILDANSTNKLIDQSVKDAIDITQYALKTELPDVSIDMLSYGVEWDITVADPTCTRIGNPLFHKSLPIQSKYKGCVVKNGKLQYYLNPNNGVSNSNTNVSYLYSKLYKLNLPCNFKYECSKFYKKTKCHRVVG